MSISNHDPLIGKRLGDYDIVGILGQGGMARVYRGYDDKLQRYAAVKVFDSRGVTADDLKEYSERFQREARAVARLRHPHIVSVYQSGQSDNILYMAMMLIDGKDLRQILKDHSAQGTHMSFQDILRIITDVASALDYAHKEGVIHRDIKPSNIMVMADGHAILTDFGLALSVPEGTLGTTFGSVHYIAPEQAVSSAHAVPQSDLYSLGVVLYEMLTGRVPFDDDSAMSVALKHLSDPPPPPRQFNPQITPQIETMVMQALQKEPEKRFQTGAAFIQALETALGMTDLDEATRKLIFAPNWLRATTELAIDTQKDAPSTPAKPSAASSRDSQKSIPLKPRRSRTRNIAGIVFVLLIIAGGIGLLAVSNWDSVTRTPTAAVTMTATASGTVLSSTRTPLAVAALTEEATEESTSEVMLEPSATVTRARATPTQTRTMSPTATPTLAPTLTTTRTPSPTADSTEAVIVNSSPEGAQLQLIYDGESLVAFNRSNDDINLMNLLFVQTTGSGRQLEFRANSWSDGTAPLYALPPGDCFQVWRNDLAQLPKPDFCDTRHAWSVVSSLRWFWISDVAQATFDVRRGETVLAECSISAGECLVDLRG